MKELFLPVALFALSMCIKPGPNCYPENFDYT